MDNQKAIDLRIIKKIIGNVEAKKCECLHPQCTNLAINSHLLQTKGILNQVSEKNHLIEVRQNDFYSMAKGGQQYIIKKIGINNAISKPLFCNFHDTTYLNLLSRTLVVWALSPRIYDDMPQLEKNFF